MKILTRREFRNLFNSYKQGLGNHNSPLWVPEQSGVSTRKERIKSKWFICVKPIAPPILGTNCRDSIRETYSQWCQRNCKGRVLCYSSDTDNGEEWYGFTCKDDILLWVLKWA